MNLQDYGVKVSTETAKNVNPMLTAMKLMYPDQGALYKAAVKLSPDYTNPLFLGVLLLSVCAIVVSVLGVRSNYVSPVLQNLRDAAIGLLLILYVVYGVFGFKVERTAKAGNTQIDQMIAKAQKARRTHQRLQPPIPEWPLCKPWARR